MSFKGGVGFLSCSVSFVCIKQKTAYEMRISDWSSDVCSSDLQRARIEPARVEAEEDGGQGLDHPDAAQQLELDREFGVEQEHEEIGRASCRERVCQYV